MQHHKQTNHRELRLIAFNANGLKRQIFEFQYLLVQNNIDIALISESHLQSTDRLSIRNYEIIRTDRPYGRGGGTAVIIKSNITYTPVQIHGLTSAEITAIKILLHNNEEVMVAAMYFPPNKILTPNEMSIITNTHTKFIIGGDLNAKHRIWNSKVINPKGRVLQKHADQENYRVIAPNLPTHYPYNEEQTPDVLDIFLLKTSVIPGNVQTINALDSDHLPILVHFTSSAVIRTFKTYRKPCTDWSQYKNDLSEVVPGNPILNTTQDIEEGIKILSDTLLDSYSKASHFSEEDISDTTDNTELIFLIQAKHRARKKWQDTGDPQSKRCYNRLNKAVRNKTKLHKISQFESAVKEISENPDKMWTLHKRLLGKTTKTSNTTIKDEAGRVHYSPIDKANIIAHSLENRFRPNTSPINQTFIDNTECQVQQYLSLSSTNTITPTSPSELKSIIAELKRKKSAGPDKVTTEMLVYIPKNVTTYLTKIYNTCLKLQYFPKAWKHAHIVTFPKPRKDPMIPNNRRPISLLNIQGKILEKIIARRLLPILQIPSKVHHEQFGFKKHHSTIHQLKRITTHITNNFQAGQHTIATFLDIAYAFDTVWHSGLLFKLIKLSIDDSLIHLIHSFLTDRTFQVKMDGTLSIIKNIKAGVPQGSVLAPHLYSVYVHDIPLIAECNMGLYADDTTYFTSDISINIAQRTMQKQLKILEMWLRNWRIKVNISKTQAIIFTRRKPKIPDHLNLFSEDIYYKQSVKYLGVTLDKQLRFHHHVEAARNKALARFIHLYPLLKSPYIRLPLKKILYTSVIRSQMTYGCEIWSNAKFQIIRRLHAIQRKVSLTITGADYRTTNKQLQDMLEIESFYDIIQKFTENFHKDLLYHPNPLIRALATRV